MSKRKDIEIIHNVKGISYKEARRLYKDNGEDLLRALGIELALKSIADMIPVVVEGLINTINSISEFIASTDWRAVIEELKSNNDIEDKDIEKIMNNIGEVYINE